VSLDAGHRAEPDCLTPQVGGHRSLQPKQDGLQREVELTVTGEGDDCGVERSVRVILAQIIAGCVSPSHLVQLSSDAGQGILPGDRVQRKRDLHSVPFQQRAEVEQLVNVALGELSDPRAAPRQVLDQPLVRQRAERLAQRCPTDREPLHDLLLHQPLAGRQLAGEDLRPQTSSRDLHQARRVQRVVEL